MDNQKEEDINYQQRFFTDDTQAFYTDIEEIDEFNN